MGIPTNVSDLSTFGPGQKVLIGPFCDINMITSLSLSAMLLADTSTDSFRAPYAGSIIGITAALNTAVTAGSVTFFVTKNGSSVLSSGAITAARSASATQKYGIDTFVAGDLLGVQATTTAAYAPTTNDPAVFIVAEI